MPEPQRAGLLMRLLDALVEQRIAAAAARGEFERAALAQTMLFEVIGQTFDAFGDAFGKTEQGEVAEEHGWEPGMENGESGMEKRFGSSFRRRPE